ncbi:MAG TPA: tetratricopeptide repeat protein, partial [Thauera aminoaromatica]|nr:tetratricopeptide repeat protein [Thauera aminoaromatica]
DLLFAEAAQARALPLLFLQPFGEDEFIARSVRPVSAGEQWVARYRAVAARLASPPHAMLPAPAAAADNPFERCNRWLLDTALACGGERVWLLCLWDGRRGDGAGGTAHMVEEVSRHRGHVLHIDTRELRPHDPAGSPPLLD